jgi:hypothetical protein
MGRLPEGSGVFPQKKFGIIYKSWIEVAYDKELLQSKRHVSTQLLSLGIPSA